jgi:Tol biopolymer transport system component
MLPHARIVFAVYGEGGASSRSGIYTVRPDGSSKTRLASGTVSEPKWSPGHDYIAYVEATDDGNDLRVMDDDGSHDRLIARVTDRDLFNGGGFAWSPDGSLIAFAAPGLDSVTTDIFVASPDGSSISDVTEEPGSEAQPGWSPDGKRIVFVKLGYTGPDAPASPSGIFTIAVDGDNMQQVTSSDTDFEPAWSPDGDHIVFSSYRNACCYEDGQGDGPYTTDLLIVDPDGGDEEQITSGDCHWEYQLEWLPDSSGVLYTATDDDDSCVDPQDPEIRLVTLEGDDFNLTRNKRFDYAASLSPDGWWLTYHSIGTKKRESDSEIFVRPLSGGSPVRVTSNVKRIDDSSPDW